MIQLAIHVTSGEAKIRGKREIQRGSYYERLWKHQVRGDIGSEREGEREERGGERRERGRDKGERGGEIEGREREREMVERDEEIYRGRW